MPLGLQQRTRIDPSDDARFYAVPRFVTHVDDAFIAQLTELYRQRLRPGMRVLLDLMSSWVSYLPPELELAPVEGHGMNAEVIVRPGAEPRFPWLGGGTDPFYSVLARRTAAEETG